MRKWEPTEANWVLVLVQVVAETLQELNPDDSNVNFVDRSVVELVDTESKKGSGESTFFDSYTLVVGTQLDQATAIKLERICRPRYF